MSSSAIIEVVDQFTKQSSSAGDSKFVETLRSFGQNDPVICRDIVDVLKKKVYCHVPQEQLRAIELLDRLVDAFDLTLHQAVNEKEFLSFIEKVITRDVKGDVEGTQLVGKTKALLSKWVQKFANDQDILPNFALTHARLVEQGLIQPEVSKAVGVVAGGSDGSVQVMDSYLLNEAEGQDPDEFKAEVKETLKLFDEVISTITAATGTAKLSQKDEVSRREALISLAANLDRYSEQFGLWIEQLDPGAYMEEAMALNDKVTEALQKYKKLRSSALTPKGGDSSSDSESSSGSESD